MVCTHAGAICHVFESELRLPKFCMYAPADLEALPPSTSMVAFDIAERPARSTLKQMHAIHGLHANARHAFPPCVIYGCTCSQMPALESVISTLEHAELWMHPSQHQLFCLIGQQYSSLL